MLDILILLGALIVIYIVAHRMDRYPWPWLSLVLILFIIMSAIVVLPYYANVIVAGLIGLVLMIKIEFGSRRASGSPIEKRH